MNLSELCSGPLNICLQIYIFDKQEWKNDFERIKTHILSKKEATNELLCLDSEHRLLKKPKECRIFYFACNTQQWSEHYHELYENHGIRMQEVFNLRFFHYMLSIHVKN